MALRPEAVPRGDSVAHRTDASAEGGEAERETPVIDWLWAGGCLSWALAALLGGHAFSVVGATVVMLNGVVAVLFTRRGPARQTASLRDSMVAGACVLMGAVALAQAPPPELFPWYAQLLFALGGLGAAVSLWALGRSFSVLPARRALVRLGPYRLIRHPIYACELLMVAACCLPGSAWWRCWPLLLTALLMVMRIRIEERLLDHAPGYRAYTDQVRYRLIYGIW